MNEKEWPPLLGKIVAAKSADSGETFFIGKTVAYCDEPSYEIEMSDGRRRSWKESLLKEIPFTEYLAEILDNHEMSVDKDDNDPNKLTVILGDGCFEIDLVWKPREENAE